MAGKTLRFCILLAAVIAFQAQAGDAKVVFEGTPFLRTISEPGSAEQVPLDAKYAAQKRVIITEKNGKYYWASRENKMMVRTESGSYITYAATDGAGYVRTSNAELHALKKKLPPEAQTLEVDYTEHLVHMFNSITFYGNKD